MRKAAVVRVILKGKATATEVARQCDLIASETQSRIDEAQRSMENGFRVRRTP